MKYKFDLRDLENYQNQSAEDLIFFFEQDYHQSYWKKNTDYPMKGCSIRLSHSVIKRERKEKYHFVMKHDHQSIEKGILYFALLPNNQDIISYTVMTPSGKQKTAYIETKDIQDSVWSKKITLEQLNQVKFKILEITAARGHTKKYDPNDQFRFEILNTRALHKTNLSQIYKINGLFSIHDKKIHYKPYSDKKYRLAKLALFNKEVDTKWIQNEYTLATLNRKLSLKKPVMLENGGFIVMRYIQGNMLNFYINMKACGFLKVPDLNALYSFSDVEDALCENNAIIANQNGSLFYASQAQQTLTPLTVEQHDNPVYEKVRKSCKKKLTLANSKTGDLITSLIGKPIHLSHLDRLKLSLSLLNALKTQAHDRGIIHRDIKPENLIVSVNVVHQNKQITKEFFTTLIDYGLATQSQQDTHAVGTMDYIAPEILFFPHHPHFKSDVFSMGCTLANLWNAKQQHHLFEKNINMHVDIYTENNLLANLFSQITGLSPYIRKKIRCLLKGMLEKQLDKRFCIIESILTLKEIILDHEIELKLPYYQQMVSLLESNEQLIQKTRLKLNKKMQSLPDQPIFNEEKIQYEKILNVLHDLLGSLEEIQLIEKNAFKESLKNTLASCQKNILKTACIPFVQKSKFLLKLLWKISKSLIELEKSSTILLNTNVNNLMSCHDNSEESEPEEELHCCIIN